MTEHAGSWILAVGGAGVIAVVYFGSLWWTVQRITHVRYPLLLVAGSGLVRVTLASLALVGVATGNVVRLLAALAVFLAVRMVWVRSVRAGAPVIATSHALPGKS